MSGCWVFGYGSLVSPVSFGHTLGRQPRPGVDFFEAEIAGFGRRWNYATGYEFTSAGDDEPTPKRWRAIALGLARSVGETTNGVIALVGDAEIAALDAREARYDRVDVTDATTLGADVGAAVGGAPVVTYVPRAEPIAVYEDARRRGVAAITKRYWDLVDGAFAALGPDRRERYHATTPTPDVPVIEQPEHEVRDRHRGVRH